MIIDIPEPSDFEQTGLDYLNLAADRVFSIMYMFDESGFEETWEEEIREFWHASQRELAEPISAQSADHVRSTATNCHSRLNWTRIHR